MNLLDALKAALPKTTLELAPIIMIDRAGYPTKKPKLCWKWSRLQLGFGWHDGSPPIYELKKDSDSPCTPVK